MLSWSNADGTLKVAVTEIQGCPGTFYPSDIAVEITGAGKWEFPA